MTVLAIAPVSDAATRTDHTSGMTASKASSKPSSLPQSMVERMTLILDLFSNREARMSLEQIARSTGLPRSTAHRILDQLVRLNWLEHTGMGYLLGGRSLGLGGGGNAHDDLRAAASPHLHELLIRTGAVIHLATLEGDRVRYLDKLGGRFANSVPSRVGGTAPASCTALGKAMLAYLEAEDVDQIIGERPSTRTTTSIANLDSLHQELIRIRSRNGLALERGEYDPEIACVAAAIRGPRGVVGAISVVATAGTSVEKVGPLVLAAARQIATDLYPELGYKDTQRKRIS